MEAIALGISVFNLVLLINLNIRLADVRVDVQNFTIRFGAFLDSAQKKLNNRKVEIKK